MQTSRRNWLHTIRIALLFTVAVASSTQTVTAQDLTRDPNNPTCPPVKAASWGDTDSMMFRVQTNGSKRVLVAEGGIDENAASRLDKAIRDALPLDELWFRSPGGVASQGPAIGHVVRKYGIQTRVPSGWWCVSACNFAFLGGPIRRIDPGGVYAVHMFTVVNNERYVSDLTKDKTYGDLLDRIARREQQSALTASEQNDFLIRMGVSRKLLTEVMYRQKANRTKGDRSTIRCLTSYELQRYNVVNAQ